MQVVKQVIDYVKINHPSVTHVFPYGSRVYGTNSPISDYDFIGVSSDEKDNGQYHVSDTVEITIYSTRLFHEMLIDHHITALECLWRDNLIDCDTPFEFNIDLQKLRESISHKVSHCWVKGKKKLTVGSEPPRVDDRYVGLKSIFHAFRICDFGIQIAHFGYIENYASANKYWEWLSEFDGSWNDLSKEFKSKLNTRMSEFRVLCPKL